MKLYNSFLGTCIIDAKNKVLYAFNRNAYVAISFDEMEKFCKDYKGVNVIHKPFVVLAYQQEMKGGKYGLIAVKTDANDILFKTHSEIK